MTKNVSCTAKQKSASIRETGVERATRIELAFSTWEADGLLRPCSVKSLVTDHLFWVIVRRSDSLALWWHQDKDPVVLESCPLHLRLTVYTNGSECILML